MVFAKTSVDYVNSDSLYTSENWNNVEDIGSNFTTYRKDLSGAGIGIGPYSTFWNPNNLNDALNKLIFYGITNLCVFRLDMANQTSNQVNAPLPWPAEFWWEPLEAWNNNTSNN